LKYEIEAELGRGGHAWVYQALDPFLGRRVAIKVLHRAGGVSDELLRRGQLEAQLLVRLRHPNIVEVIDAGVSDGGQLYIVMELLRGRPLRSVLRQHGRLRVDEALPLFRQVAEGVELAHRERAVHRDLKPENIFVCPENRPKVLDFGIAKVAGAVGITTQKDLVHGTMLYMSPEQLQGVGATPRSDVYALGTVMYEALLGRHPCILFGEMPSIAELARIQTFVQAPPIDQIDPMIPRHVARLVTRAIAKHPDDRFQSMTELADALAEGEKRFFFETGSHALGPLRDLSVGPSASDSARSAHAPGSGAHTFEPLAVSPARLESDTDTSGPPALTSEVAGAEALAQRTERMHRDDLGAGVPPTGPAKLAETATRGAASAHNEPTPSTEPHVSPLPEPRREPRAGVHRYAKPVKLGAIAGVMLGGVVLAVGGGNPSQPAVVASSPASALIVQPPPPAPAHTMAASALVLPLPQPIGSALSAASATPAAEQRALPSAVASLSPKPLNAPEKPRVAPATKTPRAPKAEVKPITKPEAKPESQNPFDKPFAFPDSRLNRN
jgi:serine/threonine-protein kinase